MLSMAFGVLLACGRWVRLRSWISGKGTEGRRWKEGGKKMEGGRWMLEDEELEGGRGEEFEPSFCRWLP